MVEDVDCLEQPCCKREGKTQEALVREKPHYHVTERGVIVTCYHSCRSLLTDYKFWIGLTVGYPIEHALWDRVYDFFGWVH